MSTLKKRKPRKRDLVCDDERVDWFVDDVIATISDKNWVLNVFEIVKVRFISILKRGAGAVLTDRRLF